MRYPLEVAEVPVPVSRVRLPQSADDFRLPPLLHDDVAFLVSRNGTLGAYSTDLKQMLWSYTCEAGWGSSQVWKGHVLTTPSRGVLSILDVSTGNEVERQDVGELTLTYSAVVGDLVITPLAYPNIGAWHLLKKEFVWTATSGWELSFLTADEDVLIVAEEAECVCLSTQDGRERWRHSVAEEGRHTLALHGERTGATLGHAVIGHGIAYLPVTGGLLLALDTATGALRWQYRTQSPNVRNFTLAADRPELYLLTENRLTVLHAVTGNVLRDYAVQGLKHAAGDGPYSPISLSRDAVWTVDAEGSLLSINRDNARVMQRLQYGVRVNEPLTIGQRSILMLNALGGVMVTESR